MDSDGRTPLHVAARNGDSLNSWIQVWKPSFWYWYIRNSGRDNIVKILIGKKADVNIISNVCETALHLAAKKGTIENHVSKF